MTDVNKFCIQQQKDNKDSTRKVDITRPATWTLVNYSAWPNYLRFDDEQRSKIVGICPFIDIDPPSIPKSGLSGVQESDRKRRLGADARTAMREYSAQQSDLRVVWGGRIKGAVGWMAGILEEVAFSLEHRNPINVLGGFGGCARLIADFLSTEDASWPEQLSLAARADTERDASLTVDILCRQLRPMPSVCEQLLYIVFHRSRIILVASLSS